MSGISGVYYLDGRPVDEANVLDMTDALAHRGPDQSGIWFNGSVGFGHRMLWTTPESLYEKLPFSNRAKGLTITADARIDNREELVDRLHIRSHTANDISDSQIILATYERWGESSPQYLIGDFAFAIWDKQKQKLFCARDPMGVKPFYYYASDQAFAFASEIKALFALSQVPRRLNELRLAFHLIRLFEDQAITFFEDVHRLPAAHTISIHSGRKITKCYWYLDSISETRFSSDDEYAEAFREIFTQAVRCRLRSAYPVGSALSGGLDSSSIACTSRDLFANRENQTLHTFSAIFPSLPAEDLRKIDERHYISAVLSQGGFKPHYIYADRLSPMLEWERVHWHLDEPNFAPNLYLHWSLFKSANASGARIFLDGLDGDSTVSHGLDYLPDLARTGRWATLISEAKALTHRSPRSISLWRLVWQQGVRPLVPRQMKTWRRLLHRQDQPRWATHEIIHPTFAKEIRLAEAETRFGNHQINAWSSAKKRHWQSIRSALFPVALELADKAAAPFALELRYPFFDRRLIEFCVTLPMPQKLHQGWTRIIMRRAMDEILPIEVQWRPTKANLGPNFKRNLLEFEREMLEEVILHNGSALDKYANIPALRAAYNRYAKNPTGKQNDALAIFNAVNLALWLRAANDKSLNVSYNL